MMQNPFDQFDAPAPAPQAPGVIMGRPKQPTQLQMRDQQLQEEAQARQAERDRLANEKDRQQIDRDRRKLDATGGIDASVEQGKAATFALRAQAANKDYEGAKLDPDSMIGQFGYSVAPGITANLSSDARNAQRSRESDFIAAVLRYESGAAIPPSEFDSAYKIYFPSSNAGELEIEAKRKARANAIEGLRLGAGPNIARIPGDMAPNENRDYSAVGDFASIEQYVNSPDPSPKGLMELHNKLNAGSRPITEFEAAAVLKTLTGREFPLTPQDEVAAYDEQVKQAAQGQGGYTERADQGITLGISDEIAGVGGAIGSLLRGESPVEGYQFSRDVKREQNRVADERTGLLGDAVEIGSSLFVPLGGAITSPARAARIGGTAGLLGGFGYGEGAQNSTVNALIGAGGGAALGAAGTYGGNALMNRATRKAAASNEMVAIDQAANELGMAPLPRIISNPSVETRGRAVAGTVAGGQTIREGVRAFGDDIEGAVNSLSTGTAIRDNEVAGGIVREAAQRQIKQTGESARRSYDRAEKLAGNARVTPSQSVQLLDQEIASLSETAGLNSAEISFLQTLKDDFSKDLSVGALRRARTTLRKKISKGDLVFGENEARVLSVMDAAAADIEAGLRSQGKGAAAQAFRAADTKYRARMDYINNTLQKVIGKRDSNLSNEAVLRKFRGLATPGGDSEGLKKFYASLTPDEAADVSATFAEMLGRGGKDGTKDFSTAVLVDNIEQLKKSGAAMTTLFGRDGAKALDNILLLAREHKRVTGAISGQGSAQGNDWRWMLASMFFPSAGTAVAGGDAALAAGMGVAGFAIKAGRDALSAKLLMSPRFTGWMRSAPRTTNPKAINAHFAKLGAIAKANPAIASEIGLFRETMLKVANDNANKAVAQENEQ